MRTCGIFACTLRGKHHDQSQLAAGDQIVAIPTLVRKLPEPLRKIVGDLRDTERALVGLQLRPATPPDYPVHSTVRLDPK